MDDIYIELVLVVYDNNNGKELCYAPLAKVEENDIVETEWGRGTAVDVVTCQKDSSVYSIVNKALRIRPVLSIIKPIDYGEEA